MVYSGGRSSQLAVRHELDPRWVSVLQHFAAAAYQWRQMRLLGLLLQYCNVHKPAVLVRRWAWDETGQKLTTSLGAESNQERSTWQVCVMRMQVPPHLAGPTYSLLFIKGSGLIEVPGGPAGVQRYIFSMVCYSSGGPEGRRTTAQRPLGPP